MVLVKIDSGDLIQSNGPWSVLGRLFSFGVETMPVSVRQSAAIPVRDGQICMVTSSSGRRWVIPKGQIDAGHTAGEAALIEAWEEAGLLGLLDSEPVGSYHYEKYGRDHHVVVYVMRVTEQRTEWPERGHRMREWVSPETAMERVEEPGLRMILRQVFWTGAAEVEASYT